MTSIDQALSNVKVSTNGRGGSSYVCPWDVAKAVFPMLDKYSNFPDAFEPFGSALFETLIGLKMIESKSYMFNWCANAREHIKGKKPSDGDYVGDMDSWLYLIHDSETKTVFRVHDSPTCADINNWIIIWDHSPYEETIYIAQLWDRTASDYKKRGNLFTKRPDLRFWADRNYVTQYVKEHHMTPCGGIYGDLRDAGFLIKFKKYKGELEGVGLSTDEDPERLYNFYTSWKHMMVNVTQLGRLWKKVPTEYETAHKTDV